MRHARTAASPLALQRGSAAATAAELATTPSSGIVVQSSGDCQLANFGVFAIPERLAASFAPSTTLSVWALVPKRR